MNTLFDQPKYSPKNTSVLRMVNDFEQKHSPIFSKVRTQWLPAVREFLREETGLRMHQKVVSAKIHKDSNISFHFVTDRNGTFIKLIDQYYLMLEYSYLYCNILSYLDLNSKILAFANSSS